MKKTFASNMRITVMFMAMACVVLSITSVQAAQLAFDDFSTYSTGDIHGQAGAPTGFAGSWSSTGGANATAFTAPTGFAPNGVKIVTSGSNSSIVVDALMIGASWSDIGVSMATRGAVLFIR